MRMSQFVWSAGGYRMMLRTRILIVDDQPRARQSLRALLATCPSVETVGEAGTGSDALQQVKDTRPDLVLLDILMPGKHDGEIVPWVLTEEQFSSGRHIESGAAFEVYRAGQPFPGGDTHVTSSASRCRLERFSDRGGHLHFATFHSTILPNIKPPVRDRRPLQTGERKRCFDGGDGIDPSRGPSPGPASDRRPSNHNAGNRDSRPTAAAQ